jgi:hypothetical protein
LKTNICHWPETIHAGLPLASFCKLAIVPVALVKFNLLIEALMVLMLLSLFVFPTGFIVVVLFGEKGVCAKATSPLLLTCARIIPLNIIAHMPILNTIASFLLSLKYACISEAV